MKSASLTNNNPTSIVEQPDVDSSTADYKTRFSGAVGDWFISVQCQALSSMLSTTNQNHILDFGGGHGQNIQPVLDANHRLTILGSTDECKTQIETQLADSKVTFITGSLLNAPFADNEFDVCLSFRMLTHLNNWQQHIDELCRIAKQSVIIEFPCKQSCNAISTPFFTPKKQIEKNTRPFALFDEQEIVKQLSNRGFELNSRVKQYFLPMALYRLLNNKTIAVTLEATAKWLGLQQRFGSPIICHFNRKSY